MKKAQTSPNKTTYNCKMNKIIISGGGTGGHLFPALSIANHIKHRWPDADILFIGADNRMEMERVPAAGYRIIGLPVSGFNRKRLLKNFKVIFRLLRSLRTARKIIRQFKPDIAIGVGGYASAPTLWMASMLRIPILIQEQNSYAGVTNRLLGKRARKICVAYPGMEKYFPANRIVITGNPVRAALETIREKDEESLRYFGMTPDKPTVLILGGSLGARTINNSIRKGLTALLDAGIQVIWQTGRLYYKQITDEMNDTIEGLWVSDFIDRMDYAYSVAELVVSRAGAGTISELCLLKKAALLVPSPNVAEDHQTKNARTLSDKDAAVLIPDRDADSRLIPAIISLMNDKAQLNALSEHIAAFAQHNSTGRIVQEAINLVKS